MRSTITQFKGGVKSGIITALKQRKSTINAHCIINNYNVSDTNRRLKRFEIDKEWLDLFLKTIDPKLKIYQHTEVAIFFLEE